MNAAEFTFDIRMSAHHNIIPSYSQQDATFLDLFIYFLIYLFLKTIYVFHGFPSHHQEHTTVQTASGIVNQYCC